MPRKRRPPAKKRFPWLGVSLIVIGMGLLFSVGGFAFAASQEAHDSFCASCHTQPESTYYGRSTAGQAVDLASYHQSQKMNQPQKVNCIDCHSGQGLTGRISAELLGASNAVKWYTGTAVQPAVLNVPHRRWELPQVPPGRNPTWIYPQRAIFPVHSDGKRR